jgi:hypothetical protein
LTFLPLKIGCSQPLQFKGYGQKRSIRQKLDKPEVRGVHKGHDI